MVCDAAGGGRVRRSEANLSLWSLAWHRCGLPMAVGDVWGAVLDLVHLHRIAQISEQCLEAAHRARERLVDYVSGSCEGEFKEVEE
jgi:hypothetical protein